MILAADGLFTNLFDLYCIIRHGAFDGYFLTNEIGDLFWIIDCIHFVSNYKYRTEALFNAFLGTLGMPGLIAFCTTVGITDITGPLTFIACKSGYREKHYQ